MGTLGNQPPRESRPVTDSELDSFLKDATRLAKKHAISVDAVIAARHVLELERGNDLYNVDGDYRDEQMGGFGKILDRVAYALEDLRKR